MLTKWDERLIFSGAARVVVEVVGAVVFIAITRVDFATGTMTLRGELPWNYMYMAIGGAVFSAWAFFGVVHAIGTWKALQGYREGRHDTGQYIHDHGRYLTELLARVANLEEQTGIENPYASGGHQDDEKQAPRTG